MRTQLDPAAPSTTTSSSNTPIIHDELVELGLIQPDATPQEQREAIRVFQQARHLPETGVLDDTTRAELQDSLRMRRSMLRNAAAAGEGGPVSDSASTIAGAESLAMARFASASSTPRAITRPRIAQSMGRNLGRRTTRELLSRAAQLQHTLDETPRTPQNLALRRATLTSLMALYDEVDRRVHNAPINDQGLPQLGVEWDPCSPLAGSTLDLHPFSNRDEWAAELGLVTQRRSEVRPDPIPTPEPTPTPEPPTRTGVPIDSAVDAQAVVDELDGSRGGFMPAATAPVAAPVIRVAAELVADVIAPIAGGILNAATLIDAWMLAENNHEAMGRALGATLGLRAATSYHGPMRAAIRDGLSARELETIIHANPELRYEWVQQAGQSGTGVHAAEDALPEGVELAADLINQALDAMRARLDQEGIDDPVVRDELMLRAANEAATIALGPVGARLAEIRTAVTPDE